VFWDDEQGKEVAELEFRERVRGLACRRGWLAVALRRRVVVFKVDTSITRFNEWDTCDNTRGALTDSTGSFFAFISGVSVLMITQVY
jgi:WD repeat-containing protein 45